jgi:hypothetical protein
VHGTSNHLRDDGRTIGVRSDEVVKREKILAEITRTAAANGGIALGIRRFEKDTGIVESAWRGRYWRTWSDALVEAGFAPNVPLERISDEALVLALVDIIRRLGRFPAEVDLRMERSNGNAVPSAKRYRVRIGDHAARVEAVRAFVQGRAEYDDVHALLPLNATLEDAGSASGPDLINGHVYMIVTTVRDGKRFKIGCTEAVPRRHRQIALELPERPDIVHVIDTDDPFGIERYWHNRFADKRTNGEWFALNAEDVRAFKRRKFM